MDNDATQGLAKVGTDEWATVLVSEIVNNAELLEELRKVWEHELRKKRPTDQKLVAACRFLYHSDGERYLPQVQACQGLPAGSVATMLWPPP